MEASSLSPNKLDVLVGVCGLRCEEPSIQGKIL